MIKGMSNQRFELRFTPSSRKDYDKLDGSVRKVVNKKLEDLEERADEIGKLLSGNLAGCREIKLRSAGIRIIYKITAEKVDILTIVDIITIFKREPEEVFNVAVQRIGQQHGRFIFRRPSSKE
jgi:mRNA interferase RelE/StbE